MAIGSDKSFLATREGFEPPELLHSSVFKTAALNRTLPPCRFVAAPARFELTPEGVKDLRTTIALRGYCGDRSRIRTENIWFVAKGFVR